MARRKIIPKRIGRVKVPKALRRLGDEMLADPRSREMAGRALLALGAALLARGTAKSTVLRDIFQHPKHSAKAAADGVQGAARSGADAAAKGAEAVSGVAEAVSQVVGEVFDSLRRDIVRKIRPVRPRHAHDEHEEDRPEGAPEGPPDGTDDRMH